MSDDDEIIIQHEERDPSRLDSILRHSVRREEVPVMLVQLPNLTEKTMNSESPVNRRRVTIVNTTTTPMDLERDMDPMEWHFRQNTPDLRTSLLREGAVDELSSRRKSKVGNTQTDQIVMMTSNATIRYPIKFGVEEENDKTRVISTIKKTNDLEDRPSKTNRSGGNEGDSNTVRTATESDNVNDKATTSEAKVLEVDKQENSNNSSLPPSGVKMSGMKFKDSNIGTSYDRNKKEKDNGSLKKRRPTNDEEMPAIDNIMYYIDVANAERKIVTTEDLKSEKSTPKASKKDEPNNFGNEITVFPAHFSSSGQQSPFKKVTSEITVMPSQMLFADQKMSKKVDNEMSLVTVSDQKMSSRKVNNEINVMDKKLPSKKTRDEIVVMPAQFSTTDQKSPFKKTRDELRPRPSSRVRVLIMLDEWGEPTYYLEDDDGKRRLADGDGKRRDPYGDDDEHYYGSARSPLKGKKKPRRGGPWDDEDFDQPPRGRKTGDKNRERGKRGNRPGDRAYDDPRYRKGKDGPRLGKGLDDDDKSKQGNRPGDRDYDDPRYRKGKDGSRLGKGWDDDDKSKQGNRPGYRDYDDPKYGRGKYGTRPGKGWDEDDDDRSKGRKRPRDRRGRDKDDEDYTSRGRRPKDSDRKYGDGTRPKGKGKGKSGGDSEPVKYRTVTMPKSATMLTSRRRYHVQITDHEMKEPWFNSCFNISKENNVDFNYEGPVKITPYYVGDKFS